MRARLAAALRKIAARLDPDREFVLNTVNVHIDAEAIHRELLKLKRRNGGLGLD